MILQHRSALQLMLTNANQNIVESHVRELLSKAMFDIFADNLHQPTSKPFSQTQTAVIKEKKRLWTLIEHEIKK